MPIVIISAVVSVQTMFALVSTDGEQILTSGRIGQGVMHYYQGKHPYSFEIVVRTTLA